MRALVGFLVLLIGGFWIASEMRTYEPYDPSPEERSAVYEDQWIDEIAEDAWRDRDNEESFDTCVDNGVSKADCHTAIYGDDGGW